MAGIPCGKGWIKAGQKCKKQISAHHAASAPTHAGHASFQGAIAAINGTHSHSAANPSHANHADYLAGFAAHGGSVTTLSSKAQTTVAAIVPTVKAATAKKSGMKAAASAAKTKAAASSAATTPTPAPTAKTTKAKATTAAIKAPSATTTSTPANAIAPTAKAAKAKTPAKAATAASVVKLNTAGLTTAHADLQSRFGKKLVSDAENNVKKILDKSDVFVRVGSADTLEKIIGGGFKTSAELNVTSHSIPNLADKNYQDARNRVEAKTLGYDAKSTDSADRPIYGYIAGSDLHGQAHADVSRAYGSIAVKLKSDVKDRTSFTGSDSFKSGIASSVNNPSAASLVSITRHGYDRAALPAHYPSHMKDDQNDKSMLQHAANAKSIDDLVPHLSTTGNAYMEAQVHGGVKAHDIGEIHFTPSGISDRPNAAIAQFAKANNVPLYVNGSKLSHAELDHIITPPKDQRSQRLKDLKDALDKSDMSAVADIADKLHADAKNVKLAPGETDQHLKLLLGETGFDGKPQVGSKADLDAAAKNGQTMMARGVDKGNPPNQYHDQFKTGDYFTGNGIYGNGTYVGHSGTFSKDGLSFSTKNTAGDLKRAVGGVAKHNYINDATVNMRMALAKDAVVVTQKKMSDELATLHTKVSQWVKSERQKIQPTNATTYTAQDTTSHKAEAAKVEQEYAGNLGKPKKALMDGAGSFGNGSYTVTVPVKKGSPSHLKPVTFTIDREDDDPFSGLFGSFNANTTYTHHYTNATGEQIPAKSLDDAIKKGLQAHYEKEAAARLGFSDIPIVGKQNINHATQQKLNDLTRKEAAMHTLLFGDEGNGASGRYAAIHGIDAIALNGSYEPDTFMNLLNRSKVLIEDTPFKYHANASL